MAPLTSVVHAEGRRGCLLQSSDEHAGHAQKRMFWSREPNLAKFSRSNSAPKSLMAREGFAGVATDAICPLGRRRAEDDCMHQGEQTGYLKEGYGGDRLSCSKSGEQLRNVNAMYDEISDITLVPHRTRAPSDRDQRASSALGENAVREDALEFDRHRPKGGHTCQVDQRLSSLHGAVVKEEDPVVKFAAVPSAPRFQETTDSASSSGSPAKSAEPASLQAAADPPASAFDATAPRALDSSRSPSVHKATLAAPMSARDWHHEVYEHRREVTQYAQILGRSSAGAVLSSSTARTGSLSARTPHAPLQHKREDQTDAPAKAEVRKPYATKVTPTTPDSRSSFRNLARTAKITRSSSCPTASSVKNPSGKSSAPSSAGARAGHLRSLILEKVNHLVVLRDTLGGMPAAGLADGTARSLPLASTTPVCSTDRQGVSPVSDTSTADTTSRAPSADLRIKDVPAAGTAGDAAAEGCANPGSPQQLARQNSTARTSSRPRPANQKSSNPQLIQAYEQFLASHTSPVGRRAQWNAGAGGGIRRASSQPTGATSWKAVRRAGWVS
eukprot:TRINITY_DN94607_c0_g1_i1.p1 TRINITY_DN94607_c0_g1~~TRINITY_DN94607_c0_g1_i1.p1  ORF type:complete len:557 (+),score=74.07 TRINITY_DN94607_c0_g1_i1:38-1708(+)